MKHVVFYSGGAASWGAAMRVKERFGTDDLTLLFANTNTEDPDLYRFVRESVALVGGTFVELNDGRDIWQVFKDSRYLGNTRADPCSAQLKREPSRRWVTANCRPGGTVLYLGYDWTEEHRLVRTRKSWEGWRVEAPMCEPPRVWKMQILEQLQTYGIKPPRLYDLGFPHNNCGGGCVKAGMAHFAHLLNTLPDVYRTWEENEQSIRDHLGKDVAILRDRSGGTVTPLTLKALRERIANKTGNVDLLDWGGCGCFIEDSATDGDAA